MPCLFYLIEGAAALFHLLGGDFGEAGFTVYIGHWIAVTPVGHQYLFHAADKPAASQRSDWRVGHFDHIPQCCWTRVHIMHTFWFRMQRYGKVPHCQIFQQIFPSSVSQRTLSLAGFLFLFSIKGSIPLLGSSPLGKFIVLIFSKLKLFCSIRELQLS